MTLRSFRFTLTEPLPSWNWFYVGHSPFVRKRKVEQWREFIGMSVLAALPRGARRLFTRPVHVSITNVYPTKRMIDADNVCAKLAIDAIKGVLIKDDDPRYVASVTTRCEYLPNCGDRRCVIELNDRA